MVTLVRPLKAALFVMTFIIILENFIDRLVAWLSQLDWASVLLWIAIGLVAVVLITLVVTYSVSCAMDEHFAKTIEYEASGARVYRIDSINDNVTYFDLSRISQKKNVSLKRFYSSFPAEEQDKVRTWVESILSGNCLFAGFYGFIQNLLKLFHTVFQCAFKTNDFFIQLF